MNLVILALDALTLVVALVLAALLRRHFVYIAFLIFCMVSIVRLHYGLGYSWTFVGKVGADFTVPLVMAWAGVHLAAEVKADTERKLWQGMFALLAVFGIVVSFLVEVQLDKDHKTETDNLRGGIREDVATAILKYNETHPSHPITSDLYQIIKGAMAEKLRPNNNPQTPPAPSGNERIGKTMGITDKLRRVTANWEDQLNNLDHMKEEAIYHHQPPWGAEQYKVAEEMWKRFVVSRYNEDERKKLFAVVDEANKERNDLLTHIPATSRTAEDTKWKFLDTPNPYGSSCFDPQQCASEMAQLADYLDGLARRAKAASGD
jgi:hypothetical protein